MSEKLAYTVREACAATGLGRSTLYEEVRAGRLIARKRGSKTVILEADLAAYLAALRPITQKIRPR